MCFNPGWGVKITHAPKCSQKKFISKHFVNQCDTENPFSHSLAVWLGRFRYGLSELFLNCEKGLITSRMCTWLPDTVNIINVGNNWIQNDLKFSFSTLLIELAIYSREPCESILKSSSVSGSHCAFGLVFAPLISEQCHRIKWTPSNS